MEKNKYQNKIPNLTFFKFGVNCDRYVKYRERTPE